MRPGGRPVGNSGQVQTGSQVHTSGRLAGNFGQVPIARATITAGLRLRNVHRRRVPAELRVVVGRRRGAATPSGVLSDALWVLCDAHLSPS